jgi:hypothetical protein
MPPFDIPKQIFAKKNLLYNGLSLGRLRRRGKVATEKKLSRHDDRERYDRHHCKRQRHRPYAAGPPKNCTAAVCTASTEKPPSKNCETVLRCKLSAAVSSERRA